MRIPSTLRRLLPALAVLVAACAPQAAQTPGPWATDSGRQAVPRPRLAGEVTTVVPTTPAEIGTRASAALRARGFTVETPGEPGAALRAHNDNRTLDSWAVCPWITTRDPMSEAFRFSRTQASGFRTVVTVTTEPASGGETQVGVAALNIGTYLNAFTNAPQDAPCRSTGVLEAEIMDAIRAGP